MLKALNVIFMCWTPADSAAKAAEHPTWELVQTVTYPLALVEYWNIDGRWLVVGYAQPATGSLDLRCYTKELWINKGDA